MTDCSTDVGDVGRDRVEHARTVQDVDVRAVLYVVRHADAGARSERPDDSRRPLTALGREQARGVADLLGSAPMGEILSSPFTRCVETLVPLAVRHGRRVAVTESLAEGAPIEGLLTLITCVGDRSVICTHGDMLRGLIDAIANADGRSWPAGSYDKGVTWVLARATGAFSVVEVIPPPMVATSAANAASNPSPPPQYEARSLRRVTCSDG